ncbi:low affinity immunoglobulin epsilon Fc receptor-like [Patiria miniata]|uniref:C-type lectin domain-containing protein n=1 Tax=Patiria miniata TaxID=46514 RepID=A0A914A5F4_PATMI|nr:low affinity immunoglobulin epsilon Fc receptor-like [Patiria miniata]
MQYCLQFTNPDGKAAHLVSVTSEEENQFLLSYATLAGNQRFWIGYQYDNAQGRFIWVDGTSEAGYENWYPRQPTYGACVTVYDGFWASVWCTNSNGFVCKMAI